MSKTLIIYGAIVAVIVLYLWNTSQKKQSDTFVSNTSNIERMDNSRQYDGSDLTKGQMTEYQRKTLTRDSNRSSQYKNVSYASGDRGQDQDGELLGAFDESNSLIQPDYAENDKFTGVDEMDGKYADNKVEPSDKKKNSLDEIFNDKNYLPKEKNDEWFDEVPEAISVKNRLLINVSKPCGINTIGTSLRNPSWDIRGSPPCPKFKISPWMQSTIEQDTNLKSLC